MLFLITLIVLSLTGKLGDNDLETGLMFCALLEVCFELIIVASRYT